ncbi:helix-turn-helix domain-containing protein [Delftia acidovorans]
MAEKNIFYDFIEDPVQAEMLYVKSYLSSLVVEIIYQKKWTQSEAAAALGVAQPRISEIKQAKLEKFSVDFLMTILIKLGYKLKVEFDPSSKNKPISISLQIKK